MKKIIFLAAALLAATGAQADDDQVIMTHGDDIATVQVPVGVAEHLTINLRNNIAQDGVCAGQAEITVTLNSYGPDNFYGNGCWQPMSGGRTINFTVLKASGGSGYIRQPTQDVIVKDKAIFDIMMRPDSLASVL